MQLVIDSFMSLSGSHLFISLWYSLLVMRMPRVPRVTLRSLLEAEHLKERFDILTDNCIFLPILAENETIDSTPYGHYKVSKSS